MTPLAKLLAPALDPLVKRRDEIRRLMQSNAHGTGTADLAEDLRQVSEDIERLEALAKATVSETAQCFNCQVRAKSFGDDWCNAESRTIPTAQLRGPPPDWCPLRPENGGPVLVTLRTP